MPYNVEYYTESDGVTKVRATDSVTGHVHTADATESTEQQDLDKTEAEAISIRSVMDTQ